MKRRHHNEVPPAPPGKNGWPWTVPDTPISEPEEQLPRISLVTPCLNSGPFLEECIRSVLLQNYPNLEYIIIDGGSTDQTKDVIARYEQHLSYWISEPDSGQSAAINKGMAKCSGELVNWLNADDILLPGALHAIAAAYKANPGTVVLSPVVNVDISQNSSYITPQSLLLADVVRFWTRPTQYHQPGVFLPKSLWDSVGGLDEKLEMCMDYDLYCKIAPSAKFSLLNSPTVEFRCHQEQKTARLEDLLIIEKIMVSRRYWTREGVSSAEAATHNRHMAKSIGQRVAKRGLGIGQSLATLSKLSRETNTSSISALFYFWRSTIAIRCHAPARNLEITRS